MTIISRFIQAVYDRVLRPHLPRKLAVCGIDNNYGGVITRRVKLLDSTDVWEEYESLFLSHVRDLVHEGDLVIEVGGGFGVATVTAARRVGGGVVHTFEASPEHVGYIEEAAMLNGVTDKVEVEKAIVGPARDVWGDPTESVRYPITDLSKATNPDVLILDCEGAEGTIIEQMDVSPRVCIVEIHPHLMEGDDSTLQTRADIRGELEARGYNIVCDKPEIEKEIDVYIVVAVNDD